jgi:DNA-binding response OmpR family regulator
MRCAGIPSVPFNQPVPLGGPCAGPLVAASLSPGLPAFGAPPADGGLRVLLVGVVAPQCDPVVQRLRTDGRAVDVAAARTEGYRRAIQADYAVILLGVSRRPASGLGMIRRWRKQGVAGGIIPLTAGADAAQVVRLLDAGADDCLAVPHQLAELPARVRAVARRRAATAIRPLRVAGLEIDAAARAVRRCGRYIPLTNREFALLTVLIRRRGEVLRRDEICAQLYGADGRDRCSNVVDVYIRYLRNKIDRGFHPPLILTRWGEGYVLRRDD